MGRAFNQELTQSEHPDIFLRLASAIEAAQALEETVKLQHSPLSEEARQNGGLLCTL